MNEINVNEAAVEEITALPNSGNDLKGLAIGAVSVVGCVFIYRVGKLANDKLVKPLIAKHKAKKEKVTVIEVTAEDSNEVD